VNRTKFLYYWCETFGAAVTEGWVDSFVVPCKAEPFETVSRPQENTRLEILQLFLGTIVECLKQYVPVCRAELVFNSDEVGISEWEDQVQRKVIVPT
jgi:hypothetical protein